MNIKADELANAIEKELMQYREEVEEKLEAVNKEVAEETVRELNATSPGRTGKYKKGWGTTTEKNKTTIHNKTKPRLTHLLEFGHAKRGGGRVAPRPHIEAVEQSSIQKLTQRLEEVLEK